MLAQHVIRVQSDIAGLGLPDDGLLSRRQPAEFGNPELDHKATAGRQVARRIAKAGDLLGLRQQIRYRVVDEVD
ncbi:hypothetical protein D9M69_574410 [compost metagenome]